MISTSVTKIRLTLLSYYEVSYQVNNLLFFLSATLGLWIPASEVERIIVNGELPPPPYGPAIPPALGQKNVYFYYGYIKKEGNESQSERLREDSTTCHGDEAARGDGNVDSGSDGGSGANSSRTNGKCGPEFVTMAI